MADEFPIREVLVQSRAQQLMLLAPDERARTLVDLEARNPDAGGMVRAALLKLGCHVPIQYQNIAPQNLWSLYYRDIKLRALDLKFYQHHSWAVQENDLYCLTRYGKALFRVAGYNEQTILMETILQDENVEALGTQEWCADEFRHGGFAENRVHIPRWIWETVAEEHLMKVDWALLSNENKN